MQISQIKSVHEVSPLDWDAVLGPKDFTHSHGFAAALEKSNLDFEYRYVVMRDDSGQVAAHAGLYLIPTRIDLFLSRHSVAGKLIALVRNFIPNFLISRVIECGSPVALGRPFVFRGDLSESDRKHMIRETYRIMSTWLESSRSDFMLVRDFGIEDQYYSDWKCLTDLGLQAVPNLENTVMEIRWDSFDAYLADLRSSYRRKANLESGKLQKAGVRSEVVADFGRFAHRLAELWQFTADQATAQLREELTPEFFQSMSHYLKDRVFTHLYWRGDIIVAFSLYYDNGSTLVPLYVGIDYSHNTDASLVFNSYYDWIKVAIERKYRYLDLGITTYEPKLRLGAELEPLSILVRHRFKCLTRPMAAIYRQFTPQQEETSRSVFKKPSLNQLTRRLNLDTSPLAGWSAGENELRGSTQSNSKIRLPRYSHDLGHVRSR